jgi:hypothetical protein
MLVQDTIGCFAQIERSEAAIIAALSSQDPIWFLVCESDEESAEVTTLTTRGWRKFVTVLNAINNLMEQGLLHVLHSSRFLGNDPWSPERFRDWGDLYRHLSPRLEKLNTVQLVVVSPAAKSVISVRKHALEPERPLTNRILRVSAESVSGSTGTVPWDYEEVTGWIDDFAFEVLDPPTS